jgi:hypothetical protein
VAVPVNMVGHCVGGQSEQLVVCLCALVLSCSCACVCCGSWSQSGSPLRLSHDICGLAGVQDMSPHLIILGVRLLLLSSDLLNLFIPLRL